MRIMHMAFYRFQMNKDRQERCSRYCPDHALWLVLYQFTTAQCAHLNTVVRKHWGIENKLHWTLDIAFREDECKIRKGHGPENIALLRHIALNKLKNETTLKCGIKTRRKKAGWCDDHHQSLSHLILAIALSWAAGSMMIFRHFSLTLAAYKY